MSSDTPESGRPPSSSAARIDVALAAAYMSYSLTLVRHAIFALIHDDKAEALKALKDLEDIENKATQFADELAKMAGVE